MRTTLIIWVLLTTSTLSNMVSAQQEQKERPHLDLKQIKAHLKVLDISLSPFEAKATLLRLNETNIECQDKMGAKAETDFDGGCGCSHWKYEHNSTCEDRYRLSSMSSGLDVEIPGLMPCFTYEDCTNQSLRKFEWIRPKISECEEKRARFWDFANRTNSSIQDDLRKRDSELKTIEEWIKDLRKENHVMVASLKHYHELNAENKRLNKEFSAMKQEKDDLEHKISELRSRLEELRQKRASMVIKLPEFLTKCQENFFKMREGLVSRGIPLPKLEIFYNF